MKANKAEKQGIEFAPQKKLLKKYWLWECQFFSVFLSDDEGIPFFHEVIGGLWKKIIKIIHVKAIVKYSVYYPLPNLRAKSSA